MAEDCKLSIVVACRNDDHGGEFLQRARIFVYGLTILARKYNLLAELIFVDWNPPEDRPPFSQALDWDTKGPLKFRFVQVPGEIHRKLKNFDVINLHQMIAKNVGIRRARAPFVLATNMDLLFSEELIQFLAQSPLDDSCMYRIDRLDVPAAIPEADIENQLQWCQNNVIRTHIRNGGTINRSDSRRRKEKIRKLPSQLIAHTNGSGDFTLMAKDAWERVRGYLEIPYFCLHLDGLLCLMAIGHGVKEQVLEEPMCLYHIDHGLGWASLSFREQLQFFAQKPWLDYSFINDVNDSIAQGKVPELRNNNDWGLLHENLHEEELN
ncbi:MAG TPA: hypothetical protein VGK02_08175 [Candidatus Aquicultor sp.]|jgi:hypothetical protein